MSSPEQALRPAAAPRCLLGLRLSAFSAAPPSLHRQIRFGSSDGKVLGEEKDARKLTQIRFGSSGGNVLSSSGKAARCSLYTVLVQFASSVHTHGRFSLHPSITVVLQFYLMQF